MHSASYFASELSLYTPVQVNIFLHDAYYNKSNNLFKYYQLINKLGGQYKPNSNIYLLLIYILNFTKNIMKLYFIIAHSG